VEGTGIPMREISGSAGGNQKKEMININLMPQNVNEPVPVFRVQTVSSNSSFLIS
jgi:hypothetical protein